VTRPYIIALPWNRPPLSQNDRDERARGGARKIADAKAQACAAVRAAHLTPIVGAEVTLHYRVPDRRRRDADNLAVVLKVVQDALVIEGVLPRDDWVHVPRSGCVIHPPNGQPAAMWLELESITFYESGRADG
jgi:hypothetical protein